MKNIYQSLPLILGFGLVGCNFGESVNDEATKEAEKPQTEGVEQSAEFVSKLPDSAATIKVAITSHGAPFVIPDENGLPKGVDIDIMHAIGENQGFKVNFYTEKWVDLFPSIESGKYDMAINGINYSKERAQKYGLSDPYFYNPSAIMYVDGVQNINTLQDLNGLKVGVVEASKQYSQLKNVVGIGELTTVSTSFLLFQNIIQGKIDAIAMDMPTLQHESKQFPDTKVKFLPYEDESNPSANAVIVMAKENDALLQNINEGIAKIKENGEYAAIQEKWLSLEEK